MFEFPIFGTAGVPKTTAAANTAYTYGVEPFPNAWTGITYLNFTIGTNAELLTVMRPLGFTHLAAAALAAQATVVLNADPGVYSAVKAFATADLPLAGTHYVAYQCPDGTFRFDIVSSGTFSACVLTNNVPTGGLPKGTPFWFFGLPTSTNPYDAKANPTFTLFTTEAKGALSLGSMGANSPFIASYGQNNPLILYVNNVTQQSWIENGAVVYYQRPGPYSPNVIPIPNG